MDSGGLGIDRFFQNSLGVEPDRVFGSEDDVVVRFTSDGTFNPNEFFPGSVNDSLSTVAFGLSTGTQSGTYFDFVTGTRYVTGEIDDGRKDELEVKTSGSNIKVYINDELVLTRPAAGVNRVVLNGSSDKDELDASHYSGPTTQFGRGGKDELECGSADDLLFGGDGDDELDGGPGNDLLFGEAGRDKLKGDAGNDVLVGGDGDDDLDGGAGFDVLIGGLGADKLQGGGGGDLLIGGYTLFDDNAIALNAIMAEWSSSRSYATRVDNLRGAGTGPRANDTYFLKSAGPQASVFDDSEEDKLTGDSGLNWFFAHLSGKGKDKNKDLRFDELFDEI